MTHTFARRQFLQSTLGLTACAACLQGASFAAVAREKQPPVAATQLADNVWLFTGAGANIVALRGPDGALLIDSGATEKSGELLKAVTKATGVRKVSTVFNTHWHSPHTGGNERLARQGAKIIAHENTKLWMGTEIELPWLPKPIPPAPKGALPTETFYTEGKLTFGDEEVQYGYLPQCHTDGDIYVFLPKSNVLAVGGIVSGDAWPTLDWYTGGWIGGLVNAVKRLGVVANDNTRVVAANGRVMTRADLLAQGEMYAQVFGRLQKSLRSGLGPDEAFAANPTAGYDKMGDPKVFVAAAFRSMWGHLAPDA